MAAGPVVRFVLVDFYFLFFFFTIFSCFFYFLFVSIQPFLLSFSFHLFLIDSTATCYYYFFLEPGNRVFFGPKKKNWPQSSFNEK